MSKTKRNALILLAGAGVLIILLAMSLPTLHLFPGEPFSLGQPQTSIIGGNASLENGDLLVWVVRGFIALVLIFLPVYVIESMMSAKGRRRLIFNLILIALLFYLADYLHNHPLNNEQQQQEQAIGALRQMDIGTGQPIAQFTANPPSWVTVVVIVVASVITVGIIVVAVMIIQRQRKPVRDDLLDQLAEAAQSTVAAIQSGSDFRQTVIRCYLEMMRVVREAKGIARDATMTPHEFEDQLVRRGLPQDAIRTLTRLFEQVRYGSLPTDPHDEELAVTSLTEIAQACGVQLEN